MISIWPVGIWEDPRLHLHMMEPVWEYFQHCVQSPPGLLLENLKKKTKWWTKRMPDHWFKQKTSTDMVWWSNQCTNDVWGRTERKQLCCCSSTIMIKIGCSSYFTPQFILKSDLFNVKTSTRATYLTISLIPHLMAEGPLEGLCLTPDQFLWECPKKEKLLGNAKM